jgi:hypothetical protein
MRIAAAVSLGALAIVVTGLAVCAYRVSQYEQAFEATRDREALAVVISRFGEPSIREVPLQAFTRYADRGCNAPCSLRAWWEHPILKGIEAWSVEFNSENQVVQKAHWVSP